MEEDELSRIVKEITGRDDYKIVKPWFRRVCRLEKKEPGLISKISEGAGKAGRAALAGLALATASIPAQSVLDHLIPKYGIVEKAEASEPDVELEFNENDAIVLGSNMLINGLMGGFGAHKQHSPHMRFYKDPYFWKGFRQGAIGGVFVYAGEKTMIFQNEFDYSILLGKEISDLGTSITYSASLGESWMRNPRFMTDIGPLVLSWNKERGLKPELWVIPSSVFYLGYAFSKNRLNLEESLKTGLFVFDGTGITNDPENPRFGCAMGNIVIVDSTRTALEPTPAWNYNYTLAHESIHTRNYFALMPLDAVINYYLKKAPGKLDKNDSIGFLRLLSYENHPFRFGADMGGLLRGGINFIASESGVPYSLTPNEFPSFYLFNFEE